MVFWNFRKSTIEREEPKFSEQEKPCQPQKEPDYWGIKDDDVGNPFAITNVTDNDLINYTRFNPILSRCVAMIRSEVAIILINKPVGSFKKTLANETPSISEVYEAIQNPFIYASKNDMLQMITWQQILKGGCYLVFKKTAATNKLYIEVCSFSDYAEFTNHDKTVTGIIHKNKNKPSEVIPFVDDFTSWITKNTENGLAIKYTPSSFDKNIHSIPLLAAITAAKLHTMQYLRASVILENNPILPSIIAMKPITGVTQDSILKIKGLLEERLSGARKQGKPIAAYGELEVHNMSQVTENLFSVELIKQAEISIAVAMGVPPDLLGLGNGTYENMQHSMRNFLSSTVYGAYAEPLINTICGAFVPSDKFLTIDKKRAETPAKNEVTNKNA